MRISSLDVKAIAGNRFEHRTSRSEFLNQEFWSGPLDYKKTWKPVFTLIGSVSSTLVMFL